jgi:hypothetical protein
MRRAPCFTFGRGAFEIFTCPDGVTTWNALDILWESMEPDGARGHNAALNGMMQALDFTRPGRRKWIFQMLMRHLGRITNREILSFLFHGVDWKVNAPRQLRTTRNLQRYDTRARGVQNALVKWQQLEYVQLVRICKISDGLSEDGANPFLYLHQYDVPIGGIDKSDGDTRVVGDASTPHNNAKERNAPHGRADGDDVMSFNDMSGPKGKPPASYDGPLPFPHPEVKPRPRDKYAACAVLSHYAQLADSYLASHDDDVRHMFPQFFMRTNQLPLMVHYIVTEHADELYYTAVRVLVMTQGARNSSKIACNFAEEWLDAWRRRMDVFVEVWITNQTTAFQNAYAKRVAQLGRDAARPFWGAVYTDNFDFTYIGAEMFAFGTSAWKRMNADANIRLQDVNQAGTCIDWIGGRTVLNAGIGCLTPSKLARAVVNNKAAAQGELNEEHYQQHVSFLTFCNDLLDWPPGALQSLSEPLAGHATHDAEQSVRVDLVDHEHVIRQLERVTSLLHSRPLASFWTGVKEDRKSVV